MPKLIFVRHAETDFNRNGIFAGRTDCNITAEGFEQAKKLFFVASEAQPFFASGGLGDVIGSLPKRIAKNAKEELEVSVILPLYSKLNKAYNSLLFIYT